MPTPPGDPRPPPPPAAAFSLRTFVVYNGLVVAAFTLVTGLVRGPRDLWAFAAIYAIITVTISAVMEVFVPIVDRLAARRGPRAHLLALNLLYLLGGAAGFAGAFWIVHLIFGIGMTRGRVVTPSGLLGAGLVTVFVGNLIFTYERLRARVRETEAVLSRQAIERERLETLRAEAELSALQARVNPHFLFNTLNSLAALIPVDPAAAEEMTQRLSDCFRYALRASHGHVALAEEIAFVENYLALEKLRFGDRLRVRIHLDPAAAEVRLPGLLVQPLVENALKHGIAPLEQGGSVTVAVRRADGRVTILVEDDGRGLVGGRESGPRPGERDERPRPAGAGTGLANVRDRLRSAFGEAGTLDVGGRPQGGTAAIVRIPCGATTPAGPRR